MDAGDVIDVLEAALDYRKREELLGRKREAADKIQQRYEELKSKMGFSDAARQAKAEFLINAACGNAMGWQKLDSCLYAAGLDPEFGSKEHKHATDGPLFDIIKGLQDKLGDGKLVYITYNSIATLGYAFVETDTFHTAYLKHHFAYFKGTWIYRGLTHDDPDWPEEWRTKKSEK